MFSVRRHAKINNGSSHTLNARNFCLFSIIFANLSQDKFNNYARFVAFFIYSTVFVIIDAKSSCCVGTVIGSPYKLYIHSILNVFFFSIKWNKAWKYKLGAEVEQMSRNWVSKHCEYLIPKWFLISKAMTGIY